MNFKDKLKQRGLLRKEDEGVKSVDLIRLYHNMMKFYNTWIPLTEFLEIPIPLMIELNKFITQDKKLERVNPDPVVIFGFADEKTVKKLKREARLEYGS